MHKIIIKNFSYMQFNQSELMPKCKTADIKVCVTLNSNLDKKKLEKIVDYVVEE